MEWEELYKSKREIRWFQRTICLVVVFVLVVVESTSLSPSTAGQNSTSPSLSTVNQNSTNSTEYNSPTNITLNRTEYGRSYPMTNLIRKWELYSASCPLTFFRLGDRCYFYGYFPLNWFRASEFCHSLGQTVSLAVIDTEQENKNVKKWLKVHGNRQTGVWIGGSENGHLGKWAWFPTVDSPSWVTLPGIEVLNGTGHWFLCTRKPPGHVKAATLGGPTGEPVKYDDWGPSQPSGGEQHCMYMVGGILEYQWADFHCDFEMHFFCEFDVNANQTW